MGISVWREGVQIFEDKLVVCDFRNIKKLKEPIAERIAEVGKLGYGIKRSKASSETNGQEYFIIDRTHTPWGFGGRKDKFPTQFQMYDESRIDTIHWNGDQGDQFQMAHDVENERAGEPLVYFHNDGEMPRL